MTALLNRVADVPLRRRPVPALGRVLALLLLLMDTFAEAQELARTAHQRFPFAEW